MAKGKNVTLGLLSFWLKAGLLIIYKNTFLGEPDAFILEPYNIRPDTKWLFPALSIKPAFVFYPEDERRLFYFK